MGFEYRHVPRLYITLALMAWGMGMSVSNIQITLRHLGVKVYVDTITRILEHYSKMVEYAKTIKHPCPRQEKSNQGRPSVHSSGDKLDFIYILIVVWHKTSRDMESSLSAIDMPWWTGEPIPDHTAIARHLQTTLTAGRDASRLDQIQCSWSFWRRSAKSTAG